jgi:hypothetical protein
MQTNVLQGMRAMICWAHQQRRETQMTPLQSDALAMLALFICIAVLAII